MVRGKRGFDRIISAFTNVLDSSLSWLFVDLQASDEKGPIEEHNPEHCDCKPQATELPSALVPILPWSESFVDAEYQEQLLEWLSMTLLVSPRVRADDHVDAHLANYRLPSLWEDSPLSTANSTPASLVTLHWSGLIPSSFISRVFLLAQSLQGKSWILTSAKDFNGSTYAILAHQERQILSWECA
jgi:ribonuclease P/MRP protein subunit RPP40